MMSNPSAGTPQHLLVDAIHKAMADALAQALTPSWSVEIVRDGESEPDSAPRVCFRLSLSGALQGSLAIQIPQTDALLLAQKLRSEAADAGVELSADHKQALQTLLQQVSVALTATLKDQMGAVEAQLTAFETPAWPGKALVLQIAEPSAGKVTLELRFDPELTTSLAAGSGESVASQTAPPSGPVATESSLDLLLGVGLSLTLRFGQRVLTLREILDLGSGSVVELDRQVQEPADLLLGDRLVARGEVVIVDGNYGVRVTEVIDPRQRMDHV